MVFFPNNDSLYPVRMDLIFALFYFIIWGRYAEIAISAQLAYPAKNIAYLFYRGMYHPYCHFCSLYTSY